MCDPIDPSDNVNKFCKFVGVKGLAGGSVQEGHRSIHTEKITRLTKASALAVNIVIFWLGITDESQTPWNIKPQWKWKIKQISCKETYIINT